MCNNCQLLMLTIDELRDRVGTLGLYNEGLREKCAAGETVCTPADLRLVDRQTRRVRELEELLTRQKPVRPTRSKVRRALDNVVLLVLSGQMTLFPETDA